MRGLCAILGVKEGVYSTCTNNVHSCSPLHHSNHLNNNLEMSSQVVHRKANTPKSADDVKPSNNNSAVTTSTKPANQNDSWLDLLLYGVVIVLVLALIALVAYPYIAENQRTATWRDYFQQSGTSHSHSRTCIHSHTLTCLTWHAEQRTQTKHLQMRVKLEDVYKGGSYEVRKKRSSWSCGCVVVRYVNRE